MGRFVFKLPDVGEGIAESEIAEWRVQVGDVVAEDQPLVDMLTDKAAVELPSPRAGKVLELRGQAGEMIAVGSVLVVLEVEGAGSPGADAEAAPTPPPAATAPVAAKPTPQPAPATPPSAPPSTPAPAATAAAAPSSALPRPPGDKPLASPAVRRRAHELGVALQYVPGSGPAGQIRHEDLDAFIARGGVIAGAPNSGRVRREGVEAIKIIGVRRKIAEAMQRSKQRIPHFAYVEEVDVTAVESLRQHLNERHGKERGKLTLLPFLVRALTQALPEFPQINGSYDDEAGIAYRHAGVHAGIATQTPSGLMVPVLRHAEAMDLWQIAGEIRRLAQAAREGKASREELSGSTITITSLGAIGGIVSTPVINAPEVAIVGVNKMVERPVVRDGQIVIRQIMNLSSSFDHRIVDGYNAAEFVQRLRALLEQPASLFID